MVVMVLTVCENLYLVEYAIIDYRYKFKCRGKVHRSAIGEIKKETMNFIELELLKMQAEDGLTVIYSVELLKGHGVSTNERMIEYVNNKGFVGGTVVRKREHKD